MVEGKENYKFDLGVKGITVLRVDWSVIIVLCTEKGWDCWIKAGKAQCATSRRKGMEYNHFELHCHFLCLRCPQDEKKKGCYHLIVVVSHHLLLIYCKINMIFFLEIKVGNLNSLTLPDGFLFDVFGFFVALVQSTIWSPLLPWES